MTDSVSNIDQFNTVTAEVFVTLYQSFPVEIDLDVQNFTHENISDYYQTSDLGGGLFLKNHAKLIHSAIRWLIDEGYIRTDRESKSSFRLCILTSKGLEVLNLMPDSLDSSIGEKLVSAVKEESKTAVRSLIQKALSYGVTIAAS